MRRWERRWERVVTARRRDDHTPRPIMRPFLRWFYFRFLKAALRLSPRPVWRVPGALLACVRMVVDADTRRFVDTVLPVLGIPPTRRARWRLRWIRCYRQETDMLLNLQSQRLTRAWVARSVRCSGTVPIGGAILVAPHLTYLRLGTLLLSDMVEKLGCITGEPRDPAQLARRDPTFQHLWRLGHPLRERVYGGRVFRRYDAGRRGLRFLNEGGYLVINADDFTLGGTPHLLLGREWWLPRGPVWFAQRSGKPIIPLMVEPEGRGWCLRIGDPVPPVPEAVMGALEACIRRTPGSWDRVLALEWLRRPEGRADADARPGPR